MGGRGGGGIRREEMEVALFVGLYTNSGTTEAWKQALFGDDLVKVGWSWYPGSDDEEPSLTVNFGSRVNKNAYVKRFDGLGGVHSISISKDGRQVTVTFGSSVMYLDDLTRMAQYSYVHGCGA